MRERFQMIEVGMKVVGNWGAMHAYSYGVVTDVYHYNGEDKVVVDFDDIDGLSTYDESEFISAANIGGIGVYIDDEGMVY
jgi:hypothetical protein